MDLFILVIMRHKVFFSNDFVIEDCQLVTAASEAIKQQSGFPYNDLSWVVCDSLKISSGLKLA